MHNHQNTEDLKYGLAQQVRNIQKMIADFCYFIFFFEVIKFLKYCDIVAFSFKSFSKILDFLKLAKKNRFLAFHFILPMTSSAPPLAAYRENPPV